jgi:hypothetical protein
MTQRQDLAVEGDASVSPPVEVANVGSPIVTASDQADFRARQGNTAEQTQELVQAKVLPNTTVEGRTDGTGDGTQVATTNEQSEKNKANLATLMSGDAKPEDRLRAARELAQGGMTSVSGRGRDGQTYNMRLELEPAGSREMVHVHMTGADGKERVALRGIARADGTFEQERDSRGRQVSYEGRMGSMLQNMSVVEPGAQPNPPEVQPDGEGQPRGRGDRRPGRQSVEPLPPQESNPPVLPGEQPVPYGRRRPEDNRVVPDVPPGQVQPREGDRYAPGAINRSQFDAELRDPRVMAAFAGRMRSEVGSMGPAAQLAFAEEVMNRAASRNQTIMQALSGSYYPTPHPGRSDNPAFHAAITKAWQEGTDTILGATGNASGRVGFGRRGGYFDREAGHWVSPNQTRYINGERFGYEQVDLNRGWMAKYNELKNGDRNGLPSFARNRPGRRADIEDERRIV